MFSKIGSDFFKGTRNDYYMCITRAYKDGEICSTKTGNRYGCLSVRACEESNGTPVWLKIMSFKEPTMSVIANVKAGETLVVFGIYKESRFDNKTFRNLFAEYVLAYSSAPASVERENASPNAGDFAELDDETDLPF